MKKSEFMSVIAAASHGIDVSVKMPDLPELEHIINGQANVEKKGEYYDRAYDDDMCLRVNPSIRPSRLWISTPCAKV